MPRVRAAAIADVAADDLRALALELRRDVLLAVEEAVEHAHLVARGQQLVDEMAADVAGAAGDRDDH